MKHRVLVLALLGAAFGAGCQTIKPAGVFVGPPSPQNFFSGEPVGYPFRRVALLPIFNEKYPTESVRVLDSAFNAELTKKSLFEVVPVSQASLEKLFGDRQLSSVENLPANLLEKLRERYGVDGILFTDITHYSPYRPISIGVRAKLIDATSGDIRWAFDYLFDSGNPGIAAGAKTYQAKLNQDNQPLPGDGGTVLISPTRFAKYVANQTYVSLTLK